jgi:hypothetical protein
MKNFLKDILGITIILVIVAIVCFCVYSAFTYDHVPVDYAVVIDKTINGEYSYTVLFKEYTLVDSSSGTYETTIETSVYNDFYEYDAFTIGDTLIHKEIKDNKNENK